MDPAASLLQVRVGRPRNHGVRGGEESLGGPWRSAIFKEAVNGPLQLGTLGLDGDEVADLKHHGGRDQAVLAYASEHYPRWREEGLDADAGAFGENFLLAGLTDHEACIGDIFALGKAVVQISHPRQPCNTLARRFQRNDVVPRVWATARGGWYLRVLETGLVQAGGELVLRDRPSPEWTVARVLHAYLHAAKHPDEAHAASQAVGLTENWVQKLQEKAGP